MWFGKHKDQKLIDVPAGYLMWLDDQPWFKKATDAKNTELRNYIKDNWQALQQESNGSKS